MIYFFNSSIKIQRVLFLVILSTCFFGVSIPLCVIDDSLANVPYRITLYDIRPCFSSGEENIIKPKDKNVSDDLLALGRTPSLNNVMAVSTPYNFRAKDYINFQKSVIKGAPHCFIKKYEKTRMGHDIFENMKFMEKYKRFGLYQLRLCEKKGMKTSKRTGKEYQQDFGVVPIVFYCDKTGERPHGERSNLYDMFSLQVDDHLLSLGIAEEISLSNRFRCEEKHFQISLFGSIEIESMHFFQIGFFQYTFNHNCECYHRAFKPWTVECLKRLSNSYTQDYFREVLYDWLSDLENFAEHDDASRILLEKLQSYNCGDVYVKNLQEALGVAGFIDEDLEEDC